MSETILALIVLLAFVVGAFLIYFVIKNLEKKRASKSKQAKFDGKPRLKLNLPFLSQSETKFLAVFQNSLPSEYVAFPKIVASSIVKPDGSLVVYHEIEHNILDVVVFLKTKMQPVLVVDLIDPSKGDKSITTYNDYIKKGLSSVKLPVLSITLDHDFERVELLNMFLDAMDPVNLSKLK